MRKVWQEIQSGREWIVDAGIKGLFDKIEQDWMIRMVEHRIGDQRVVRLI